MAARARPHKPKATTRAKASASTSAAPARPIHGEASRAEAEELIEEGVPILPLPILPDDRN